MGVDRVTCPYAQWGHGADEVPHRRRRRGGMEWKGKELCGVPTAAYPLAVDTIMFRVWRTHSVLLTARGHMVRSRPQTVSPRVVHAREPRDEEVQRAPEDKAARRGRGIK